MKILGTLQFNLTYFSFKATNTTHIVPMLLSPRFLLFRFLTLPLLQFTKKEVILFRIILLPS